MEKETIKSGKYAAETNKIPVSRVELFGTNSVSNCVKKNKTLHTFQKLQTCSFPVER
jgi:hypothetical protein